MRVTGKECYDVGDTCFLFSTTLVEKIYTKEAFNILYNHDYLLPPHLASQLIWCCFINVHGSSGRNIPTDLRNEHLNRVCKEAVKSLGANKTEAAIIRVGKALGTLSPVLDNFDMENDVTPPTGRHKFVSVSRDQEIVSKQLSRSKVFCFFPKRKHCSFSRPTSLLDMHVKNKVTDWMLTRVK